MKLGDAALREAVERAGARFVGVQSRPSGVPLLLFNDASGSTRSLDVLEIVGEAIRAKLAPGGPDRLVELAVRGVAELHRLGEAVETIAQSLGRPAATRASEE